MNNSARAAYLGQMTSTASPARLLVMLVDRLVLDLERAIDLQEAGDHLAASEMLKHAQDIVLELRTSLRVELWEGAEQLAQIYGYVFTALVRANVQRDASLTRECLALIEPLADAWRQAALTAAMA